MQLAYHLTEGGVVAGNGPDTSDSAIRAASFALEYAVHLAVVALSSFIKHQLSLEGQSELKKPLAIIMVTHQRLSEVALSRGWGNDPFPGRWRV
jgi:hypothetical protein